MENPTSVLEFKCPCCNAGLVFGQSSQQMTCEYCGNTFDLETVYSYNASEETPNTESVQWEETGSSEWSDQEQSQVRTFLCHSCGGELMTDDHTAATFCPFCGNPTILPGRVSGTVKPDGVIPFKTGKEDAKAAFLNLCKGKPLLPKFFTQEQQVEKITGIYVPFWLYDCSAEFDGSYKATRVHHWMDSQYTYTKTDHYLVRRQAQASYAGIPMDASSKMEDAFMESIEPYDYSEMVDFDMAYLSGFFADKYDVSSQSGEPRIRERVENALNDEVRGTIDAYATIIPSNRTISIGNTRARYVLLPVWLLNTNYQGKTYTFAMNGQTGKMTGSFPICPKRSAAWFAGLMAAATAVVSLIQLMM